jgi:hypothetical protein
MGRIATGQRCTRLVSAARTALTADEAVNAACQRKTLPWSPKADFGAFLDRPFAVALFVLAIAALVLPATVGAVRRVRGLGGED